MAEVTDGVFASVFCDGTTWVREDQNALSDCKICTQCWHEDEDRRFGECRNLTEWSDIEHLHCATWWGSWSHRQRYNQSRIRIKILCGSDLDDPDMID